MHSSKLLRTLCILAAAAFLGSPTAFSQDQPASTPSKSRSTDGTAALFQAFRENPKLREMFRESELRQLKDIYGAFVTERRFNPQETEQFYRFLLDESMQEFDDASEFVNAEGNEEESAPSSAREANSEKDRQFRMLLGDANYARFQEYMKTASDRLTLSQLREQFRLNNVPFTDEEASVLLQIMWEERAKSPPMAFDPRSLGSTREKTAKALEGDNAEKYYEQQSDLNGRILSRAGAVLNKQQYEALDKFQERHLEAQKAGIEAMRARTRGDG